MMFENKDSNNTLDNSEIVDSELLDAMGISRPVYDEVMAIVGHLPTIDEMGTLIAMWKSQDTGLSLLSWLKGQFHSVVAHDYLESDTEPESRQYREPEVRECIAIARTLFKDKKVSRSLIKSQSSDFKISKEDAIYMVGNVSGLFTDSEYGRRYLHIVANPIPMENNKEAEQYLELILGSLKENNAIFDSRRITEGGLFGALLSAVAPYRLGFNILTCREVRMDAFLFGEQGVRFLTFLDEPREDFFLQKLVEARVNSCFLGRVTGDRMIVDGVDFGRSAAYSTK